MEVVVSAISVLATSFTLVTGLFLFARQIREARQSQAALVAAWTLDQPREDGLKDLQVILSNSSNQPVYDLVLHVELSLEGLDDVQVFIDSMTAPEITNYDAPRGAKVVSTARLWILPPGFREPVPGLGIYGFKVSTDGVEKHDLLQRIYSFELTLTDVHGRRWRRDHRGRLAAVRKSKRRPSFFRF